MLNHDEINCIMGLGNPGKKYFNTRHNLGFMVIDRLLREHVIKETIKAKMFELYRVQMFEKTVDMIKPLTFMNLSGKVIFEYSLVRQGIFPKYLVICDDFHLAFGKLRFRKKGSSGGHRGLESLIGSLGSCNFHRLRIGIGRPPENMDIIDYVLSGFYKDEVEVLEDVVKSAANAVEIYICKGMNKAMNTFN